MTTIKERINKYITEHLKFTGIKNPIFCPKFDKLKPIFNKFTEHFPDIEFLRVDDDKNETIIIYTNYNIKFDISGKLNDRNILVPKKFFGDDNILVYMYPLDDQPKLFTNEDYYADNSSIALYVNNNGYVLVNREDTYDVLFDITKCNFKKGIMPCVFISSFMNHESFERDNEMQAFFNYITSDTP